MSKHSLLRNEAPTMFHLGGSSNGPGAAAAMRILGSIAVAEAETTGRIGFATEKAQMLFQKFFGGEAVEWLVPPLLRWVSRGAADCANPQPPWTYESGDEQLLVHLTGRHSNHFQLLLEERSHRAAVARLSVLGLTPREAEVLLWIARGKTCVEIAIILRCAPRTISKHTERILAKLSVETRTSAAALALQMIG